MEALDTENAAGRAPEVRKLPDWPGLWDYCPEADCEVEQIEGQLPEGLVGALVRNGPGKRQLGTYFFDGDGLIRRVRFGADGKVHYRSRYVHTPKYLAELHSDVPRVRTAGTQLPGGPLANALKLPATEANTHVVEYRGKLLALFEGGPPFALDMETLETRGVEHFDRALSRSVPFSAHPHLDPTTGELFNFGISAAGRRPKVRIFKFGADGAFQPVSTFELPFFTFLHDFAISENWLAFGVPPVRGDMLKMMSGVTSVFGSLRSIPNRATQFVLASRDGSQIKTFDVAPVFVGHSIAAREEGDEVVVDLSCAGDWDGMVPELSRFRTASFDYVADQYCMRYRFNLRTGRTESQELLPMAADFPRHDERRASHEVRYAYLAGNPEAQMGGLFRALIKLDLHTLEREVHDFGPGHQVQEPVFVPRSPDSAEDEGWILNFVHDGARQKTNVTVLDAQNLTAGPVCTVKLPVNAGMSFHGSWLAG